MGVRLRSILTSSHKSAGPKASGHGVFKRPHSISVFVDRLALSANHRRLRFSFQINDVKDLTGEPAPPVYAGWRRGAADLVAAPGRVNRPNSPRLKSLRRGSLERKNRTGAAEGLPS